MAVIHGARIRLRRRKFKLCTRLTILLSTIIFFIGLLVISAMYIHLQSALNSTNAIKDDGTSIFNPVGSQDEHNPRHHNEHNDKKNSAEENTKSVSRVIESEEVPLTPFVDYANDKLTHLKVPRYSTTHTWIDADSQIIHTYNANTNVEMVNPRIHFRDRFDHTKSSLEQRKSAIYKTETIEPFDGNVYVKWKSQYKPLDEYTMPVFATIKEKNTLNHASIFISIAAFRDSECAPTIESALKRARSPHRIYAGISEERLTGDVDCLSQLNLNNSTLARQLLYGDNAPSSLTYELRNLTWKEIMRDRGIIATSVDEMNARNTTTTITTSSSTNTLSSSSESLISNSSHALSDNIQQYNSTERKDETINRKSTNDNKDNSNQTVNNFMQEHEQEQQQSQSKESISMTFFSSSTNTNETSQKYELHSATDNLSFVQSSNKNLHSVKLLDKDQVIQGSHSISDKSNKNKVATKIYLDPSYITEHITCVAGTMETQRDRFLLSHMHHNSLVSSRFRHGRGGAQEK